MGIKMQKLFLLSIQLSLFLLFLPSYAGSLNIGYDSFNYDGTYYDGEDATLYLQARNYNALSARFISQDTYQYFNRYSGFGAEPITHVDPTGHSAKSTFHRMGHVFNYIQDSQNIFVGGVLAITAALGGFNPKQSLIIGGGLLAISGALGLAADISPHSKFGKIYNRYRVAINVALLGTGTAFMALNEAEAMTGAEYLTTGKKLKAVTKNIILAAGFTGIAIEANKGIKALTNIRTAQSILYFTNTAMILTGYFSTSLSIQREYQMDEAMDPQRRAGLRAANPVDIQDAEEIIPLSAIRRDNDPIDLAPFVNADGAYPGQLVAHQAGEEGVWHAFREENITAWLGHHYTCPLCRVQGGVFQRYNVEDDRSDV